MNITRRNLLLGSGAGALAGAGLSWRDEGTVSAASSLGAKKLILVVASGGWDPVYALDPKPNAGAGIDVPAGALATVGGLPIWEDATRPAVSAFFAAHGPTTTIINGVAVQSLVHSDCAKRVLTGTNSDTNPDIGAIIAYELGRDRPAPYLVLGQTSYSGPLASISARAGTANQIGTLLDPLGAFPDSSGDFTPRYIPDDAEAALIRGYVQARTAREQATRGMVGHNQRRLQDFADSLQRGDALRAVADFGDFDFTRDLGVQAQIALDALQQGVSQVVQMEISDWDTHSGNAGQSMLNEGLYAGLLALVDELSVRPGEATGSKLIDETVVVVVSEMGRTPRLNDQAGKDHWPVTSAIVVGGGLSGGRVLGGTDAMLQAQTVDLATGQVDESGVALQYGNLAAGLLAVAGVDPTAYLANSEPLHALCT
jgi:hypothetical protein